MKYQSGTVMVTDNFGMFELMEENRKDAEVRAEKIKKSVEMAGRYILAPIIVTDQNPKTKKYPIVDGQARYTYCKKTGTPIAYSVVPGLTIDDCIAMNASTSNWKLEDYIESYAVREYSSYVLTRKFIKESPYGFSVTIWALKNTDTSNINEAIKNGSLLVTQEMYDKGLKIIEYWKRFDDILTNRRKEFLIAIGYCYLMDCVDNETLDRKIHQRPRDFMTIATVTDAIDVIEDSYNMRTRNHVYIETEYYKFLDEKTDSVFGQIVKQKREKNGK